MVVSQKVSREGLSKRRENRLKAHKIKVSALQKLLTSLLLLSTIHLVHSRLNFPLSKDQLLDAKRSSLRGTY